MVYQVCVSTQQSTEQGRAVRAWENIQDLRTQSGVLAETIIKKMKSEPKSQDEAEEAAARASKNLEAEY
jgi:hypothetical protein